MLPDEADSPRLLISAGPTHEPIDSVRYIGNRSSGRLGVDLADAAARAGWPVTLLLGPTTIHPIEESVTVVRFRSTADLEHCLGEHLPACDILVMAAAVADYTPAQPDPGTKLRRVPGKPLILELSPTPDLLAGCSSRARADQLLVGFALEPKADLLDSALRKLDRKKIDMIVANPLETMESASIEAQLIPTPALEDIARTTGGPITKAEFAIWLLSPLLEGWAIKKARTTSEAR